MAVLVPHEVHGGREVRAVTTFFVRGGDLEDLGHHGPRFLVGTVHRWLATDGQGRHRRSSLPVGGANAVRAGVTASEHDHVLAARVNEIRDLVPRGQPVGSHQVVHGVVNPLQLTAWDIQFARAGGAGGNDHGVVAASKDVPGDVLADLDAGAETRALGGHDIQATVHH